MCQSIEGPNRAKRQNGGPVPSLLELRHSSSPALGYHIGTSDSLDFRFRPEFILPADSKAFGIGQNDTTGFLGSLAYRQQIIDFLGLYNHMS